MPISYRESYFNRNEIWGIELSAQEIERINAIISLIPDGISSILDYGCGDGRIANALYDMGYDVVGADPAPTALKHLKGKTILLNGEHKFEKESFDLVICSQVLEHLEDAELEKVMSDIAITAKLHVIISVPYNENLSERLTKCVRCRTIYHIHHHVRSFNEDGLSGLFVPLGFETTAQKYIGHIAAANRPLLWLRQHIANRWASSPDCMCPTCGSTGSNYETHNLRSLLIAMARKCLPKKMTSHRIALLYRRING